MNIVQFIEPITIAFKKSAGGAQITFEALRDYVIANAQLDRVLQDENVRNRLYKVSRLESRVRNFTVNSKNAGTNRLLFYNGSGGYGDQIISWPVVRLLSSMGFEVHVLTEPGNQPCWYNFNWLKTVSVLPLPYETFKLYDHHFLMEAVINMDEHQDQGHPVDVMLFKMGIDPRSVDDSLKAIRPFFSWSEANSKKAFEGKNIAIYQLSSANPVRALPPNDSAFLVAKLAEAYPDLHWLCIFDEFVPPEYVKALLCRTCQGEKPKEGEPVCGECNGTLTIAKNIQPYTAQNLRELWAQSEDAKVVVSPDSMMVHIAGTMGIPCIGLWGPVNPANRVKYYKNHFPIYHREACQHSPCFAYTASFPKYCPPRGSERKVCEVMAAVNPQEVIDAVGKIRKQ